MTTEKDSYFGQIASRLREELAKKDRINAEKVKLRHRNPNGKLTTLEEIAINNGLNLPTSNIEVGNNHHKKRRNGNGRRK